MNNSYVIITPARNEEKFIKFTLNSVIRQTIPPAEWIIVNDGSTDKTADIVKEYSEMHPWIKLVNIDTSGERRAGGPKVVHAFYKGFGAISTKDYEFVTKLDADLTLPANYFENVLRAFCDDAALGICGGYIIYVNEKGEKSIEKTSPFHVRGAFKSYRTGCFNSIGGLKPVYNWDGIDQILAMYNGWNVRILPLEVIHHRPTSTLINRGLKKNFLMGFEYYRDGGDFLLSLIKSIVYGRRYPPRYISSIAFMAGYFNALLKKPEKHFSRDVELFFRNFQYTRIRKRVNSIIKKDLQATTSAGGK